MLTVGSLFSGIGGLELGLERAGMEVRWQVEIDDYAVRVLEKHWPDVPKYRDVFECGAHNLEPVDLICGGFPCQPVSVAGKRKGDKDERWLWDEFYRIICEIKPLWVVAENVPGLLSAGDGGLFAGVLRDLAEGGYDAEWQVLPASAFGAWHRRDRVFIVAYATGIRRGCILQPGRDSERTVWISSGSGTYRRSIWEAEPDVGRVVDGFPGRVDRLRCLGNAIVPQCAEYIGRLIVAQEALCQS